MRTRLHRPLLVLISILSTAVTWGQTFAIDRANPIGTFLQDYHGSSTIDDLGYTYITGGFENSITLGSITLNSPGVSYGNIFIAKQSPAGAWIWAKSLSHHGTGWPGDIALDNAGHLF